MCQKKLYDLFDIIWSDVMCSATYQPVFIALLFIGGELSAFLFSNSAVY